MMLESLLIAVGGGIGSAARYWVSGWVAQRFGETFPFGTLVVNVSGSLIIGFFAALTAVEGRFLVPPAFRQFVMLGILGGYTTFSSFSLQTLNLARDGEWLGAGANAVLSLVTCLVAVWLGHALAMAINRF